MNTLSLTRRFNAKEGIGRDPIVTRVSERSLAMAAMSSGAIDIEVPSDASDVIMAGDANNVDLTNRDEGHSSALRAIARAATRGCNKPSLPNCPTRARWRYNLATSFRTTRYRTLTGHEGQFASHSILPGSHAGVEPVRDMSSWSVVRTIDFHLITASYSTQISLGITRRMLISAVTAARASYLLTERGFSTTGASPSEDEADSTTCL